MNIHDFTMDFFSLQGKHALVTGGNTGLGRAMSLALAKAGADVMMPSIMPDAPDFNALIEAEGVRAHYVYADLTEAGVPGRMIDSCVRDFGSIDIVVNCAGTSLNKPFAEYGRREWDAMLNINLTAAFEVSHAAALHMMEQGSGKIINVCSLFSFLGGQRSPAYAATKHGLAGLTKSLCDELARYNIQVNGIAPGYFKTAVTEQTQNDPKSNAWVVNHSPAERWGEPADLMGCVVFLASRASQFVNGHILTVDGGYLTR